MTAGMIEEAIKWRRRGLDEPWLPDSFMAEMSPDAIRQLERYGRVHHGVESIALTGNDAAVVIVLNCVVKVFRSHWDGKRTLVHVAGLGDILNAEAALTGSDVPLTVFTAKRYSVVLTVPRQRFSRLVAHYEDIRDALMRSFARRVQEHEMWRGHTGRTAEAQVWAFLVGLARRHGYRYESGETRLKVGLSQHEVASALGISSSSVENAIRNLRDAGRLDTGYGSVELKEMPSEEALDQSL